MSHPEKLRWDTDAGVVALDNVQFTRWDYHHCARLARSAGHGLAGNLGGSNPLQNLFDGIDVSAWKEILWPARGDAGEGRVVEGTDVHDAVLGEEVDQQAVEVEPGRGKRFTGQRSKAAAAASCPGTRP